MRTAVLALPLLLICCADPVTVTRAVDDRPRILLQGVPEGAVLFLDGKPMGSASAYAGNPGVLLVEPGTHLVEVRLGETLLMSSKVFLGGGEQRTLAVR
ncbi:hypothetical protein [Mesoterricola silvestris]|uniref:PEGA domain-containing protein n=1 Tax=Mesoterricola silvestris TaxID=2927979 RepID=A0AA48GLI6_9BACT|nr:hypothetical protein [Mesoterricola silvestris]BDU72014.1 hypothetical protein METEAL_11880 [Mesoterricola silvestris]